MFWILLKCAFVTNWLLDILSCFHTQLHTYIHAYVLRDYIIMIIICLFCICVYKKDLICIYAYIYNMYIYIYIYVYVMSILCDWLAWHTKSHPSRAWICVFSGVQSLGVYSTPHSDLASACSDLWRRICKVSTYVSCNVHLFLEIFKRLYVDIW